MKYYKVYKTFDEYRRDIKSQDPIKIYGLDIVGVIKRRIGIDKAVPLFVNNKIEALLILNKLFDLGYVDVEDIIEMLKDRDIDTQIDFFCDKKVVVKIVNKNGKECECNENDEVDEENDKSSNVKSINDYDNKNSEVKMKENTPNKKESETVDNNKVVEENNKDENNNNNGDDDWLSVLDEEDD